MLILMGSGCMTWDSQVCFSSDEESTSFAKEFCQAGALGESEPEGGGMPRLMHYQRDQRVWLGNSASNMQLYRLEVSVDVGIGDDISRVQASGTVPLSIHEPLLGNPLIEQGYHRLDEVLRARVFGVVHRTGTAW